MYLDSSGSGFDWSCLEGMDCLDLVRIDCFDYSGNLGLEYVDLGSFDLVHLAVVDLGSPDSGNLGSETSENLEVNGMNRQQSQHF